MGAGAVEFNPGRMHLWITLWTVFNFIHAHYNDVIMDTMASQSTSLPIVFSTVYSDADQRKNQSFASLAFVREIPGDRWIPRTNGL